MAGWELCFLGLLSHEAVSEGIAGWGHPALRLNVSHFSSSPTSIQNDVERNEMEGESVVHLLVS